MVTCALTALLLVSGGIQDDFNDNARGPQWFQFISSGMSVVEQNQRLEVRTAILSQNAYAGYSSRDKFDLRGGSLSAELVSSDTQAVGWQMHLSVDLATSRDVGWLIEAGTAIAYSAQRGALGDIPLGANTRWLRIRESGGSTFYEHSADGVSWTTFRTEANEFSFASVGMTIQAGTNRTVSPSRLGIWDNVNLAEAPATDGGVSPDGGTDPNAGPLRLDVRFGCSQGEGAPAWTWVALLSLAAWAGRRR